MSRLKTWGLWIAVVALTAVPLVWVDHGPVDEHGAPGELFEGADSRAQQAITRIAPDYKPWFSPVLEPSSNEIASLLFALQAAVGAGVIGYWLGVSKARAAGAGADDSRDGPAFGNSGNTPVVATAALPEPASGVPPHSSTPA